MILAQVRIDVSPQATGGSGHDLLLAIVSATAGVLLTSVLANRKETRLSRQTLVQQQLCQLQNAVESLWHRLNNLNTSYGHDLMTDDYFEMTTLYALGRVLATERIFILDGIIAKVEVCYGKEGLHGFLLKNSVDALLRGMDFQHYDRLALAEATIEMVEPLRVSTFLQFRRRYEDSKSREKLWLAPAATAITNFDTYSMVSILSCCESISRKLSVITRLPSSLPIE